MNFHSALPYVIGHLIVFGVLLWVHAPDGFYREGTARQRALSWLLTIFWEPAFAAAIVFFLVGLVQDSIRRERLLGPSKPTYEGVATWKLATSYFVIVVTSTILCVAIII